MKLTLILILLTFCSHATATEPLPPPKAACPAAQAPVVIVVQARPLTIAERIRERRIAWHADQIARLEERQARSLFGFGVFVRVGGGCR